MKKTRINPEKLSTNLINFSFCNHKPALQYILQSHDPRYSIIEDYNDFWKFIKKYETMLKKTGEFELKNPLEYHEYNALIPYHKMKCMPIQLKIDATKKKSALDEELTPLHTKQFEDIVLVYMDFKQKEKFQKIENLRKVQRSLPIWKFKDSLTKALRDNKVLIVAGDTGCGKSTQLPQYLYKLGYRSIACTQPRRLACVSLSKRVAYEMLDAYGSKVGFQIRFERNKTSRTNILYITEGLLLRQLAVENNLNQYDCLILDEIHERNLFGDFLLGVTKCLLRAKPQLKLILMSATINVELFYNYFKDEDVQLLKVPGHLHPIKIVYMPPASVELNSSKATQATVRLDPAPFVQVLNIIDQKYATNERGDVLIFVSGVNEITTVCDAIKEYAEQQCHWIILPLHSGLSLAEQDKVFDYASEGMRKCIVATNIAETSLTVDGIRFVIDSGKVKEMSYDSSCKGQRLKEFWISKSSAEQRKGRAGRTGPGTCFRLYSEKQYNAFESYPTPEIFRVPLDTILLQMISMGLPNVRQFPFIEVPDEENIEQTILSLKQHNALNSEEKITELGKSLSNLPVEISIGKMLLMGCVFPDMEKILTLAAVMSVQNPFTSRAYTDPKCEDARGEFETDQGDVLILMNVYHEWLKLKWNRENTRKWCHKMGVEEQRFYEITKLRNQFQNILEGCNMIIATNSNSDDQLSSADRRRRHGEVRMLKALKRKEKHQEHQKRKILKRNSGYGVNDNDYVESEHTDLRDVDFHLKNNSAKLEILLKSSKLDKLRDVVLLKLIIASGFYPQISIADEFNYCKSGTQQFFHTFLKPFISIHPNTYFAKRFELLKLSNSDILEKPSYYTPKQMLSEVHQVLCYQNLLETSKPYLMNCIRMPAAQTLLLFCYSIDTNLSVTRIVCDSWLCLEFPIPETGWKLLHRAIQLRRLWNKLLMSKLADLEVKKEQQNRTSLNDESIQDNSHEEDDLWASLIDFMNNSISYTIKRLLPADQKTLYNHNHALHINKKMKINPFVKDYKIKENEEKGGYNIAENVVFGCLNEPQWCYKMELELRTQTWSCKYCKHEIEYNIMEKLLHKENCKKRLRKRMDKMKEIEKPSTNINNKLDDIAPAATLQSSKIHFNCIICNKKLHLSQIDVLKHKQLCK